IDELGYLPMTRQARYNLFQLINSLYEYRSIILTTNKDFTCWGEFFHDDNVAVPIIDRIIHHSHIFMLGGESYRLKQKTTGPFNRRQFLKFSVVSGVSIYMAPFLPKTAQATLLGEQDSRPTPWNSVERQVPFKIDGTRQVTGSKFFVRDIRAKDMPGWPE
ncbi:ATP-binding protein, partial [Enterobacter cloacae]|uniref:ATP-binding protein n=1 Tax=Enterobacter cloacae TaxID=550 RepID=UPI00298EEA20